MGCGEGGRAGEEAEAGEGEVEVEVGGEGGFRGDVDRVEGACYVEIEGWVSSVARVYCRGSSRRGCFRGKGQGERENKSEVSLNSHKRLVKAWSYF